MAPAGRCPLANSSAPAPTDPKMTAFFQFSIAPPARAGLEERTRDFVVCGPDLSLTFYAGMVGAALHRRVPGRVSRRTIRNHASSVPMRKRLGERSYSNRGNRTRDDRRHPRRARAGDGAALRPLFLDRVFGG